MADRAGHVLLLGLMASGKSTVGEVVARRLGQPLCDNDIVLETSDGAGPGTLARQRGLAALHRREMAVVRLLLARRTPSVITAAASIADRPDELKRVLGRRRPLPVFSVFLHAPAEVLAERARGDAEKDRPLPVDDPLGPLREMETRRSPIYRDLADLEVDVASHGVDETVAEVVGAVPWTPSGASEV